MSRKSLVVFVALLGCITSISAQVLGPADLEAAAAGSLPVVTNPPFVGDFWTWKEGLPLPFDLWPDLSVYDLGSDRGYLIDNRSVPDFAPEWLSPLEPAPQIASGSGLSPQDLRDKRT